MATKKQIDEFLSCKRIAVIGMSRTKLEYSRMLMDEYKSGGYEIIPINPAADEIAGVKCYKNIKDVKPKPERAIMLLPADKTEQAIIDCAAAGIKDVWLHSHIAAGVQNTKAIYQAEANKMNLITGHCPMMFLHKAMFLHKLHGGVLQLIGAYPK